MQRVGGRRELRGSERAWDVDHTHHPVVLVVEDVAVVDGAAGERVERVERDEHFRVAAGGYVDDVLPGGDAHRLASVLDDLHRPHVQGGGRLPLFEPTTRTRAGGAFERAGARLAR